MDQSISTNTNYNPSRYDDGMVPMQEMIADALFFYRIGGKTLYYSNFRDGQGDEEKAEALLAASQGEKSEAEATVEVTSDIGCDSGACSL